METSSSSSDTSDRENDSRDEDDRETSRLEAETRRLRGQVADFDDRIGEMLTQTADLLEAIHSMHTEEQARTYEAGWRWARRQAAFRSRVRLMRRMGYSTRQAETDAYQAVMRVREERAASRRQAEQARAARGAASWRDR